MSREYRFLLLFFVFLLVLPVNAFAVISVIDTSNTNLSMEVPSQSKIVYDGTYWWIFYANNTSNGIFYKYSSDLINWSVASYLWSYSASTSYNLPDVGIHDNIIYVAQASGNTVYFILGTISGTSVSWGSIRTAFSKTSAAYVSVDWNGTKYLVGSIAYASTTTISYGFTSDGVSWITGSISGGTFASSLEVVAMDTGRWMISSFNSATNRMMSSIYTGVWSAVANINSLTAAAGVDNSMIGNGEGSDVLHSVMVENSGTFNIIYNKYNSGWGSNEFVVNNTGTGNIMPVMSYDITNDAVIVSWLDTSNNLRSRMRFSNGTWTNNSILINIPNLNNYNSFQATRYNWDGFIAYAYIVGAGAPYNITVFFYDVPLGAGDYSIDLTESFDVSVTLDGGSSQGISKIASLNVSVVLKNNALGGSTSNGTYVQSFNVSVVLGTSANVTITTSTTTKFTAQPISDTAEDFWGLIGFDSLLGNLLVIAAVLIMIIFLFLIRGAAVPFAVFTLIFTCLIIVFTGLGLINGWVQMGLIIIVVLIFALTVSRRLSNG